MAKQENRKTCFVIAPIGDEGSETRRRSDQILKHVITPATKECGYQTVRADKISEPGIITSQIIQHLIDDNLVIADLTEKNPNVFYELAVRHAVKKPVVQIIQSGESIPFDVAPTRTIHVDHRDLDSVADCRDELIRQIHSVEKDPSKVDSPISVAIDLQSLHQSENPLEKSNAEIISMLQELRSAVGDLSEGYRRPQFHPRLFEELFMFFDRLSEVIELSEGQKLTKDQLDEIRHLFHRLRRTIHMIAMESGMPPPMVEGLMEDMERPLSKRRKPK
jgi:hypothetical protein